MDTAGMILCETEEQMQHAIAEASSAQYEVLAPALRAAKSQAVAFIDLEKWAAETLIASL